MNPTAGTIVPDTRTPTVSWLYAMYLFCTTRHGTSGKELQRQLGATSKTAYRMGQQIRDLTARAQGFDALLSNDVELDEAYVDGRRSGGKRGCGAPGKTIVMALAERDGAVRAVVIPDVKKGHPSWRGAGQRGVRLCDFDKIVKPAFLQRGR